jgi:hypothetical protein
MRPTDGIADVLYRPQPQPAQLPATLYRLSCGRYKSLRVRQQVAYLLPNLFQTGF